jgi:MFS family permease
MRAGDRPAGLKAERGSRRRDLLILLSGRVIRAFAFGFSIILLALYLQDRRQSAVEIGAVLAIGLAGASLGGLFSATAAARFGRRRTLAALGVLMAISGLDIAFATNFWLLALAGFTGMLGVSGTELGPFLSLEQAMLAQTSTASARNRAFARYSMSGALAGAAGALCAAVATNVARTQAMFTLYAILGIVTAVVPLFLSPAVEGEPEARVFGNLRPLIGLSALFAIDSLGGGLVARPLIVYWLHIKFGASPAVLAPTFSAMMLLGALCFELAGRLADRFGLINTMVFTHLPSNLMLIALPFMPALGWALGLLAIWSATQSMDVPARQAYVVSIVKPNERSGAVAITGAARGLGQTIGPILTGAAIQSAALGIPFVLAGVVKSIYDLALYAGFRRRLAQHEVIPGA